jgi:organic radical activating enzyme
MKKETKTICLNFKQELDKFTDSVYSLSENGSLSSQEEFVLNMADTIHKLYNSSVQVIDCPDEDVKEVGELVKNIFLQPLSNKTKKPLTILNALETFSEQQVRDSDLSAILHEYVSYPESTQSFIRELELLSEDLNTALKEVV